MARPGCPTLPRGQACADRVTEPWHSLPALSPLPAWPLLQGTEPQTPRRSRGLPLSGSQAWLGLHGVREAVVCAQGGGRAGGAGGPGETGTPRSPWVSPRALRRAGAEPSVLDSTHVPARPPLECPHFWPACEVGPKVHSGAGGQPCRPLTGGGLLAFARAVPPAMSPSHGLLATFSVRSPRGDPLGGTRMGLGSQTHLASPSSAPQQHGGRLGQSV